jgi:hypothetical protein
MINAELWLRPKGGVRRLVCRDRDAISGMQMVSQLTQRRRDWWLSYL